MFPLTSEQLNNILLTALSRGGEYADIFLENTLVTNLELQDGLVSQAQQALLYGAGIRVVRGTQTGYAYTMDLSQHAMLEAARFAGSMQSTESQTSIPVVQHPTLLTQPTQSISTDEAHRQLLTIEQKVHQRNPSVIRVKAAIAQRMQEVQFVGSDGTSFWDNRPRSILMLTVVIRHDNETQMGFASRMLQMGAEFLTDQLIDEVIDEALSRTEFLFSARQIEGGEMPVVMAAGSSGILMHEAIGHAFEADFIRTGDSIFADKLGKNICNSDISIVDDGTLPADAGMLRYDDEGILGQRTVLVDHGRLNSFMYDRISATHFGVQPTGNGRRESFRYPPLPRMRSTYMLAGSASEEDIIRSVKRGIYAQSFTNGQVQIGAGDFTFFYENWLFN